MSRAWVAVLDAPATDATAQAALTTLEGEPAGWLAAWLRKSKPVREARRIDHRIVDPCGADAYLSLVWPDRDRGLLPFDDLAVQHARRTLLADTFPPDAVSTLLVDDSRFAGAITVRRGADAVARLRWMDPLARVESGRILRVGAGILGTVNLPSGPVIERHGSDHPWPWPWFGMRGV
jgi:hypothetical protein